MSQMDGLRLLEEVKRRYPAILVVIVSGRARAGIEAQARGAVSYPRVAQRGLTDQNLA